MRNYSGSAVMLVATMTLAIGCYSLSLRVSGERAAVEKLQRRLVADGRDIRTLQAELRTRARLPELQRWNDEVATLQMKAPVASQYLQDPVQLAGFATPRPETEGTATLHYAVTGQAPMAIPVTSAPSLDRPLIRAAYMVPAAAVMIDAAAAATIDAAPAAIDRRDLEALIGSAVDSAAGRDARHR